MAGSAPPRTGIGETAETDRGTAQPGGSHNDPLGYNSARREWAKQLKIDPYTSIEARLKAMGIEGRPVREFFRNRYFTPTLQTALVAVLEALGSVAGRADVLAYATNAVSEVQARFAINSMLMPAQYNRLAAPR